MEEISVNMLNKISVRKRERVFFFRDSDFLYVFLVGIFLPANNIPLIASIEFVSKNPRNSSIT